MPNKVSKHPKHTTKTSKAPSKTEPVLKPSWPLLSPLVPATDLKLETILDDQIIVIRKFFTKSLCEKYLAFLAGLPLKTTPGQPKKGEALRVNDRFQIEDPEFANILYSLTSLQELVIGSNQDWGGEVCGLNPNIRIYRYTKGQFFDQHCKLAGSSLFVIWIALNKTRFFYSNLLD
jgi:hypothetical protein